jgi:hypothetical protein
MYKQQTPSVGGSKNEQKKTHNMKKKIPNLNHI